MTRVPLRLLIAGIALLCLAGFWLGRLGFGEGLPAWLPFVGPPPCERDPADVEPVRRPDGQPANYLHTCRGRLYDTYGTPVTVTGVNWFGMETGTYAPHGLWSRNWESVLDQVQAMGYNTVRLPFSNDLLHGARPEGINYALNPDLEGLDGLQVMDRVIDGAGKRGLRVILDRHRPTVEAQSSLWHTREVPEAQWIEDWRMLAARYRGNDAVVGVDLHNEPKGDATWGDGNPATDWRAAAERAGNAVLEQNPHLLIVVQGVERYEDDWYWWGGNLRGAREHPVRLDVPNRLVYSAHDYGPGVFPQGWFDDPAFPRNLPKVWDEHWGKLPQETGVPVLLGEFGGRSVDGNDPEGRWHRALLEYLDDRRIGFLTWSLNPNSSDTGGLLADDWVAVAEERQHLYRPYLAPPIPGADGRRQPEIGQPVTVRYRNREPTRTAANLAFDLEVWSRLDRQLPLDDLELRYWFMPEGDALSALRVEVDWASVGKEHVRAEVRRTGALAYVAVRFDDDAGEARAYGSSGTVGLRVHREDWGPLDQGNDFSYGPAEGFRPWRLVTAYVNGKLVWGDEP